VSIDLSTRPELVQAIGISRVEAGVDMKGVQVRRDDSGVKRKVSLEWGSDGEVEVWVRGLCWTGARWLGLQG
jgi:hypothetical protein